MEYSIDGVLYSIVYITFIVLVDVSLQVTATYVTSKIHSLTRVVHSCMSL